MNRFFKYLLCFTLLLLMVSSFAFAEEEIRIRYNGDYIETAAPPVIVDGRTLIPMRDIFNLFEFEVSWDADTRTAIGKKNDFEIRMPIDSSIVTVAGKPVELDTLATLVNGSTYMPVRFIAESLNAFVDWDDRQRIVVISTTPLQSEVEVNDSTLNALLLEKVGKASDDELERWDMQFIVELDLSNQKIYRLDGLEEAINLQQLNLSNNQLTIVDPIENLTTLEWLDISDNNLVNSDAFENLRALKYLNLQNNELNDLYGLEDLRQIETLYLTGNKLKYEDDYSYIYHFDSDLITDVNRSKIEEPKRSTWNLRYEDDFELEVADKVWWVAASNAGGSEIDNEDMYNLVTANTEEGKASKLNSIYELFQYLARVNYHFIDDDKVIKDDAKRLWRYHKPAFETIGSMAGSEKSLAIASAYILENDYQESGVIVVVDKDLNKNYINYVFNGEYFYIFNPSTYLKSTYKTSAIEDGYLTSYNNSKGIEANVHRVGNIMDYANVRFEDNIAFAYKLTSLGGSDAQYPEAIYDTDRTVSNYYYFVPANPEDDDDDDNSDEIFWSQRIEKLFDDEDDSILFKEAPLLIDNPSWN